MATIADIINCAYACRSVASMLISTDPVIDNLQFNKYSAITVQVFILIRSIKYALFFNEKLIGVLL